MSSPPHRQRLRVQPGLLILFVIGSLCGILAPPARATNGWSPPVEISEDQFAWFPTIAADQAGRIHVIWGSGMADPNPAEVSGEDTSIDMLRYRSLHNGVWTPMNDVVFTCRGGFTVRNSLTVNIDGRLQALIRTCFHVSTVSVAADAAASALAWTAPQQLGTSYYNALTSDSLGRLHALSNEMVYGDAEQSKLASEIFYRRSDDGGQSWSVRTNLANLPGGDERMQIAADQRNRIHVVWDHGSDWYLGLDSPDHGIYRRSDDGGETWQPALALGIQHEPTIQTTLGLTLEGNPLVVYRSASSPQVYYQYSADGGATWTAAEPILGMQSRSDPAGRLLDSFTLTVDSANRLHLLIAGFPDGSISSLPVLMHLIWDGQRWSEPAVVAQGPYYPMGPRAVVMRGNQLHAVWFTHTDVSGWGDLRVWHSSKQLDSPEVAPPLVRSLPEPQAFYGATAPNPTALNTTALEASSAPLNSAQTPIPAADPVRFRDLPPPGALDGQNDLIVIAFALAAVFALLAIIIGVALWRRAQ